MDNKKDQSGRQFIAHHDVRNSIVSAAATLTTGSAVTLISADADYFLDIVEATFANNSNAAANVLLTNDGTTIRNLQIPAGGSVQLFFDAPLKMNTKNQPWLADMEDITGTTIVIGATLIKKDGKE